MDKPTTIEAYLIQAPMDQQAELNEIRRLIERSLPTAKPSIGPAGHPIYSIGNAWKAGFAYKGQGPVIYIADTHLIKKHEKKLAPLRQGKIGLRYARARGINIRELCHIVGQALQQINS